MNNKSNLIFLFLVIIILVAGFVWYTKFRDPESGMADRESSFQEAEAIGREFVKMSRRMRGININDSFFDNEVFNNLEDLTPEISLPASMGRDNPFSFYSSVSDDLEDMEGEGEF